MPPEEQRPACQDGAPSVPADVVMTSEGIVADYPRSPNGTPSQSLPTELYTLAEHIAELIAARIQSGDRR